MNKIKLTIASVLLSGMCYAQTSYEDVDIKETVEQRQALDYRINDLINAIRMDAWYGKVSEETAKYYIRELAAIRDVNVIVTNGIAIYGINEE
tara:strand:+ start:674 stop:952 length:279 start_codon:yes stop_codon:yes gene_type:complete